MKNGGTEDDSEEDEKQDIKDIIRNSLEDNESEGNKLNISISIVEGWVMLLDFSFYV